MRRRCSLVMLCTHWRTSRVLYGSASAGESAEEPNKKRRKSVAGLVDWVTKC